MDPVPAADVSYAIKHLTNGEAKLDVSTCAGREVIWHLGAMGVSAADVS